MFILTATDLGHAFGADDLFTGLALRLGARERVGMVGANGVGKTTLLLILAGQLPSTTGSVSRQEGLTLGYLHQEAVLTFAGQENSVYEEMLSPFAGLRQQESELRLLEAQMAAGDATAALLEEYGRLQELYEHGGGYEYQHEIKRVLTGLGFSEESWQMPLTQLSGGQKTRLLLGRLLLEKPDLLILDEPTNHLDATAVEWLERTLRQWPGALLIVSHDRYFLDRVIDRVWDMTPVQGVVSQIKSYKGNYTTYVQQRQLAWEREEALFVAEKERLEKEVDFIRRNIAGGNTDMAKGKLKRLTRDLILLEQVGVTEMQNKSWLQVGGRVRTLSVNEAAQRIRSLIGPVGRPPQLNIKLKPEHRSGQLVLRSKKLHIGYPGKLLFTSDDVELERADCVALIGPNGSGKSTFLRTLMGEIPPLKGKLRLGDGLIRGYFAQGHEQLNANNRVIDELLSHKPMSETDARGYLAQYLFPADEVFKRVGDLSGGERGRLALALLALDEANFLLLDEPTNHLDIPSQETLQRVLEKFEGAIVLVSHDRYLVDRLATQIWELRDGHLHAFAGTYQEFLAARQEREQNGETAVSRVTWPPKAAKPQPVDLSWIEEAAPPPVGLSQKERRQRSRRIYQLQDEIEETEAWLAQLEYDLAQAVTAGDNERAARLQQELQVARQELDKLSTELDQLL